MKFKPPSLADEFELMFVGRSVNPNSVSLGSDRGLLEERPISVAGSGFKTGPAKDYKTSIKSGKGKKTPSQESRD